VGSAVTASCGSQVSRTAKLVAAGLVLAWAAAGCASSSTVTGGSVTACYQVMARAIQRHVTLTAVPPACQGVSQAQLNVVVDRALHAAAAGARGKVRQRQIIARDSSYVAGLIRAVPASSPPAVAAPPSGPPAVAVTPSGPPNRTALSLAALVAWLVTAGLGLSMMARWITRIRRPDPGPRSGRGPALNFTHLGLALTGLLAWISYVATGLTGLAWAACGLVLAVASLGMALVFLTVTATQSEDDPPSAGRPPVALIAAHITVAVVTILLVTLAAVGSG
jgi:manganese efflux pump family protein